MKRASFIISIIVCIGGIAILAHMNYTVTPNYLWFIYPATGLLWYPVTMYYVIKKNYKQYAIAGCILINLFLVTANHLLLPYHSNHPWYLYPAVLILWWPIVMYSGKHARTFKFAMISSLVIIGYYVVLNLLLSPIHPWALYPTFAILWWPISLYFAKRRDGLGFSIVGSIMIALFFGIINAVVTPKIIWSIYPIFAAGWWPLIMYYFGRKKANKSIINKDEAK